MRYLIALIFCLFCSCAYIDDYIGVTASSSLKSGDKINASKEQSKHLQEVNPTALNPNSQSPEITNDSGIVAITALKPAKPDGSELSGMFPFQPNDGSELNLLTVSRGGSVLFWPASEGYSKSYKILSLPSGFTSVSLSSKKRLFAVAYSGLVDIYDLKSSEKLYSLNRLKTRISFMEFSPDGESLLMAGIDALVYRWQFVLEKNANTILEAEQSLERYVGHSAVVNLVRFHPFGRVFVSSDWDGSLSAWLLYNQDKYQGRFDENIFAGRIFAEEGVNRAKGSRKASSIVEQMRFSADGQFLFVADEEGMMQIWSMRGFKQLAQTQIHKGKIYDFNLNPKSDRLIAIGRDGLLNIWQIVTKESKTPGIVDYEFVSLKETRLVDINIPNARKVIYLNDEKAILGNIDGSVNLVDVKVQ